jgi:hypothetical protein
MQNHCLYKSLAAALVWLAAPAPLWIRVALAASG